MKKLVFVTGQVETTWGYVFYQKKAILDQSQYCGGLVLTGYHLQLNKVIFQVFAVGAQCISGMNVSEKS